MIEIENVVFVAIALSLTHPPKRPSDLKQNGTQEKTPFSGIVFNTLSHGIVCFLASVSPKTTF